MEESKEVYKKRERDTKINKATKGSKEGRKTNKKFWEELITYSTFTTI
jgi:hypothetical protein